MDYMQDFCWPADFISFHRILILSEDKGLNLINLKRIFSLLSWPCSQSLKAQIQLQKGWFPHSWTGPLSCPGKQRYNILYDQSNFDKCSTWYPGPSFSWKRALIDPTPEPGDERPSSGNFHIALLLSCTQVPCKQNGPLMMKGIKASETWKNMGHW